MNVWLWSAVLIFGLSIEAVTIVNARSNDTFSVVMLWAGRAQAWSRALLVSSFAWLVWHGLYEPPEAAMTYADDWALVITAALATLVRRDPRSGR